MQLLDEVPMVLVIRSGRGALTRLRKKPKKRCCIVRYRGLWFFGEASKNLAYIYPGGTLNDPLSKGDLDHLCWFQITPGGKFLTTFATT
jgi:hypothetical protein